MKYTTIKIPEIKLVGIKVRTNNNAELNTNTAKIGSTIEAYFNNFVGQNDNIIKNGKFYSVYFEYESDHTGEYSYLFGEEVSDFESVLEGLDTYIIPEQTYRVFTTESGAMPNVVINAWQEIWQMAKEDLGGERAYKADYEVYDHRAQNPANSIVDIYIGIIS